MNQVVDVHRVFHIPKATIARTKFVFKIGVRNRTVWNSGTNAVRRFSSFLEAYTSRNFTVDSTKVLSTPAQSHTYCL